MPILLPLTDDQARLLWDALQHYQADNIAMMHGFTLTAETTHDVEIYSGIISLWGQVEELKKIIAENIPE